MRLSLARDQVFAFFAEASNLERITPPELGFEMVTPQPIHLRAGTHIEYRLRLFGIPFSWQTEMQCWDPPEEFMDIQRRGLYKHWVHTHRFRDEQGGRSLRMRYNMHCHSHRWMNSSIPSYVSSYTAFFGIGNTPFVHMLPKTHVSTDVESMHVA